MTKSTVPVKYCQMCGFQPESGRGLKPWGNGHLCRSARACLVRARVGGWR